jgi:pyruvate/2-oxoglutarate dehydrogenase complex dihydrolipoamide dehydrogenase (E3) component
MNDAQQVDLVVIGLGPGGEALATATAKAGLRVVAVDKHLVGGECPYYGCIPTKMMVRAGDLVAEAGRADQLSGDVTIASSWAPVAERVATMATDHWDDTVAVDRLADAGATVLHGVARLDGPGRVVVRAPDGGETAYVAERGVVLNPGTRPSWPGVPGLEGTPFWTNRDAVQVTTLPGSLIVLGGGPIGCELAQVFARFGVQVTVVQHGPRLLPANEPEAAQLLEEVFAEEGIRVLTGAETTRVAHEHGTFTLSLADGQELSADQLLVAAGRKTNLQDLDLFTVDLDPSVHTLEVDDRMRVVGADRLWAIGDVTGKGAFTHVSMYQNAIARRDILGEDGPPAAYHALPHVTFTDPEVAGVGMTETQARDAGLTVRVGSTKLEESSRGFTHGPGARGLVKVVEDADRGVLVGATVAGPAGGEIIGFLAVAVHAAVPVSTLESMIYAYPTFHRAIESALADLS